MSELTVEQRKEKKRLAAQAWREANRERHRAYTRQYRKDHAAERHQKNREWAKANPELVAEPLCKECNSAKGTKEIDYRHERRYR